MARLKKSGGETPLALGEAVPVWVSLKPPLLRRYRAGLCVLPGTPVLVLVSAGQAAELEADPFIIVARQEPTL